MPTSYRAVRRGSGWYPYFVDGDPRLPLGVHILLVPGFGIVFLNREAFPVLVGKREHAAFAHLATFSFLIPPAEMFAHLRKQRSENHGKKSLRPLTTTDTSRHAWSIARTGSSRTPPHSPFVPACQMTSASAQTVNFTSVPCSGMSDRWNSPDSKYGSVLMLSSPPQAPPAITRMASANLFDHILRTSPP